MSDGRVDLTMPETALGGLSPRQVEDRFNAIGIPATVTACAVSGPAADLRPLRADLVETTFSLPRS